MLEDAPETTETACSKDVAEWAEVMERCGPLADLLVHCRLDLTMKKAAAALGADSVAALTWQLRSRHLPPFRLLRDWAYLVVLLEQQRESGGGLANVPAVNKRDPAPYYRFVRRLTGQTWVQVRRRGVEWARAQALEAWKVAVGGAGGPGRGSGARGGSRRGKLQSPSLGAFALPACARYS